jgi:hypothetical protein
MAAESGYARAQYRLGRIYDKGKGVESDHVTAAQWYKKAARQGNTRAQYVLGVHYARGQGVEKNYIKSYAWLLLSQEANDPLYRDVLQRVAANMDNDKILKAKKLARSIQEEYGINLKVRVNQ